MDAWNRWKDAVIPDSLAPDGASVPKERLPDPERFRGPSRRSLTLAGARDDIFFVR